MYEAVPADALCLCGGPVGPFLGGFLPAGTPFYRASKVNFQPRAGVSYQMTDNLFPRAGAGFYTGAPRIGDLLLPIEGDRFNTGLAGGAFPVTPGRQIQFSLTFKFNEGF